MPWPIIFPGFKKIDRGLFVGATPTSRFETLVVAMASHPQQAVNETLFSINYRDLR